MGKRSKDKEILFFIKDIIKINMKDAAKHIEDNVNDIIISKATKKFVRITINDKKYESISIVAHIYNELLNALLLYIISELKNVDEITVSDLLKFADLSSVDEISDVLNSDNVDILFDITREKEGFMIEKE